MAAALADEEGERRSNMLPTSKIQANANTDHLIVIRFMSISFPIFSQIYEREIVCPSRQVPPGMSSFFNKNGKSKKTGNGKF